MLKRRLEAFVPNRRERICAKFRLPAALFKEQLLSPSQFGIPRLATFAASCLGQLSKISAGRMDRRG